MGRLQTTTCGSKLPSTRSSSPMEAQRTVSAGRRSRRALTKTSRYVERRSSKATNTLMLDAGRPVEAWCSSATMAGTL